MNLLFLVVVGLVTGWLSGKVMKGGYGGALDMTLGILGGVFGGWTFGSLEIWPGGIAAAAVVGFTWAVALVWIARRIGPAEPQPRG